MRFLLGLLMLIISGSVLATIDVMPFKNEAQEQQFHKLTEQLRCPKCQNNNIADSSSVIAADLRQKVYELLQEGKTDREIVDYMVARYGNFVSYDPPLTSLTILLWVLPITIIFTGCRIIYVRSHRRVWLKQEAFPDNPPVEGKLSGFVIYVPGIIIALVLAALSYYQTGSYKQVKNWHQATEQMPELLNRALNLKEPPLNQEEIARLTLALRTRLQSDPGSVEGWVMLGQLRMMTGNIDMAIDAYVNAWQLDPIKFESMFGYKPVQ